jgi:hypothetical protein
VGKRPGFTRTMKMITRKSKTKVTLVGSYLNERDASYILWVYTLKQTEGNWQSSLNAHNIFNKNRGARGSVVVKALCCKPEGSRFKSR